MKAKAKTTLLRTTTKFSFLYLAMLFMVSTPLWATNITFSGGYTKVSMQEGNKRVELSQGAMVKAGNLSIEAQEIDLYGNDYRYVNCTGKVAAKDKGRLIELQCPSLFYDRETGEIVSDGWVEIQDESNDATLSGARLEYDTEGSVIKVSMMARVVKSTDDGLMVCRADSIEFDNEGQTVSLKGNASIEWNGNVYNAAMIVVDLTDYSITMEGSISGEVNG